MPDIQFIAGLLLAAFLAIALYRYTMRRALAQANAAKHMFSDLHSLLEKPHLKPGESIGSWHMTGNYRGRVFQFLTITDTLAVRKLPSLWLMVTLPTPQPLDATYDIMMRPAAQTTFSKFDFLPLTLPTPSGFPEEAVVRTDHGTNFPEVAARSAMSMFRARKGKELLLSPKGLRLVLLLAESERARYGVYREARFAEAKIDTGLASEIMNTLLQLEQDLAPRHG